MTRCSHTKKDKRKKSQKKRLIMITFKKLPQAKRNSLRHLKPKEWRRPTHGKRRRKDWLRRPKLRESLKKKKEKGSRRRLKPKELPTKLRLKDWRRRKLWLTVLVEHAKRSKQFVQNTKFAFFGTFLTSQTQLQVVIQMLWRLTLDWQKDLKTTCVIMTLRRKNSLLHPTKRLMRPLLLQSTQCRNRRT